MSTINNKYISDDQIECLSPLPGPGVIIEDETPDIEDFKYGSVVRYESHFF